jgi:hypothetical protein
MIKMFSLSSPPQPMFFSSQYQHSPATPSPLRTAYNVNLSRQPIMSGNEKSSPISEGYDENWSPVQTSKEDGTCSRTPATASSIFSRTPASTGTASTTPPTTGTSASAASAQAQKFQFEARARSQSPSAQLSRLGGQKREERKGRFLDRIRNRREDATDDRMLKMQWARERIEWEEDMRRQGKLLDVPEDAEAVEEAMDDAEEGGISPAEEKEIEALAGYYVSQQQESLHGAGGGDEMIGEDDEWDEVFMEVLSQEQWKQAGARPLDAQNAGVPDGGEERNAVPYPSSAGGQDGQGGADDMDMS